MGLSRSRISIRVLPRQGSLHYRAKALAMERAWPEPLQSVEVLRGSVAFMRGETVAGIFAVEFAHAQVAIDFGDHRGGRDGDAERVSVNDAGLSAGVIE